MKYGIIKYIFVTVGLLALVACGATTKHKAGADGTRVAQGKDASQVYTSGMGEQGGFDENGVYVDAENPHDQVYYFSYDNSRVDSQDIKAIEAQARYLAAHPEARVLLAGHTDERGSREYNIGLGERRSARVADILRLAGVKNSQIRVVSYGEEKPAKAGHEEEAYQLNRRVELKYEAVG